MNTFATLYQNKNSIVMLGRSKIELRGNLKKFYALVSFLLPMIA